MTPTPDDVRKADAWLAAWTGPTGGWIVGPTQAVTRDTLAALLAEARAEGRRVEKPG